MLARFQFHRLLAVPRPPAATDVPDPAPAQLFAALIAAHADLTCDADPPGAEPSAIAVVWLRVPGDPHLRVLVGGSPTFPPARTTAARTTAAHTTPADTTPADTTAADPTAACHAPTADSSSGVPVPVLYPPGSTGVAVDGAEVVAALNGFPSWLRCAGTADALWVADRPGSNGRDGGGPSRHGSFDDFAAHLPGAFAWLVVAQPVATGVVDAERGDLLRMIPFLRRREQDGHARVELERAEARYRELTRSAATGLWDVRVLVGAPTATETRLTAALLCGAGDLDDLPYLLTPQRSRPSGLAEALGTPLGPSASRAGAAEPPRMLASGPDDPTSHPGSGYGPHGHPGSGIGAEYLPGAGPGDGVGGGRINVRPAPSRPAFGHPGAPGAPGTPGTPHAHESSVPGDPPGRPQNPPVGGPANAGIEPRFPFRAGGELLAALARPPRRELPGITLVTAHTFDVTPEGGLGMRPPMAPAPTLHHGDRSDDVARHDAVGGAVVLGQVLDAGWSPAGVLPVPRATLNRHGFVCGATGSGKSQTVRSLLESLARAADPVPWLVLEPAKAEYARMAGRLAGHAEVLVIRPGRLDAPPAGLNPLEPEPGFPLQSHIDLVRALFLAAFEAHEPFPQVLARALTVCYTDAGWDLVAGRMRPEHRPRFRDDEPLVPARPRYPTLGDLQRTATRVVETIGYGAEVTADVRGFVDVRIGSLREGTPGRFFEGGHPLDIGALLTRNVVVELEDITSDQDKAFLLGAILIRIVEHLRVCHGSSGLDELRHVLVVEEAHRLLKNVTDGPAAAAVELFASLLAEIRAYGEGVLVVEQIPSKILPDVLKNTALKVMHRLPSAEDREAVGATMNLRDDQSELVVALPPGVAAIAVDGMDRPILTRMLPGGHRESVQGARHDAIPLTGRRSLLCGTDCTTHGACTLGQVNDASHLAADPLLVVWVEAVAAHQVIGLAHLLGQAPPTPTPALREKLLAQPPRTLDCLLAHAVDRAATARSLLLRPYVDLDEFARSLADTLHCMLVDVAASGTSEGIGADTRRWTAGPYRYQDVRRALTEARRRPGADQPHPLTGEWRHRGLSLTGTTIAAQFDEMLHSPHCAPGLEAVSLGNLAASGLALAVRSLTGGTSDEHLRLALHQACAGADLAALRFQMANLLEKHVAAGGG
ncbi:helicase HerA-like domain-containing protein [Frankia sp. R82]|uniref:helicase HerA-like domain-containing protein n=1 Tax=Frankia sp. R82 TaxID=2950553 RepID=UPI0020444782|nr:DUF87 domain-containing protein [Frankia sp. R82]MCM3882850.1 DUF853 family protein [Frankia sp. R82]